MQHLAATVRLNNDLNFTVRKYNLTVPEVVLLRILHGDDAVVDIRSVGISKRAMRVERERLLANYGGKPETVVKIDNMFRNTAVQPLETLADIGAAGVKAEPRPGSKAHTLTAEDVKPYDPAEDIVFTPDDGEPEAEPDAAQPEIADDFESNDAGNSIPEPALTPDEIKAIEAEGRAAAKAGKAKK